MKAILGVVLACAACCAFPIVGAMLVGAGAAGVAILPWHFGAGAAVLALAMAGAAYLLFRRRNGATCSTGCAGRTSN